MVLIVSGGMKVICLVLVVEDLRFMLDHASFPSFHQVVLERMLVFDFSSVGVEVERLFAILHLESYV